MYVPCRIQHSQKWSYLDIWCKKGVFGGIPGKHRKMGQKWGILGVWPGRGSKWALFGGIQDMSKNKHQNVAKIGRFWPVFQKWPFGGQNRGQFWVFLGGMVRRVKYTKIAHIWPYGQNSRYMGVYVRYMGVIRGVIYA